MAEQLSPRPTSGDTPHDGRHRMGSAMVAPEGRRGRGRARSTLLLAAAAVVGTAVLTAVTGGAAAAHKAPIEGGSGSSVPAAIQPPATVVPVASYRVTVGVQIYTCTAGTWVFKAPEAHLVNTANRRRTIHHFAGPSWQSNVDGSLITAAKVAESSVAGAIPQLLLEVKTRSGAANGELARVTHIQRLATRGGLAPTVACTDGAQRAVPYGARYVLFVPR